MPGNSANKICKTYLELILGEASEYAFGKFISELFSTMGVLIGFKFVT